MIELAWKKKLTLQQKADYKAEKREKIKKLFQKIDDGVKFVFESDSYKEYLSYMGKFTNYSAGNFLLIMLRNPKASQAVAFGKWKQFGRIVNKSQSTLLLLLRAKR